MCNKRHKSQNFIAIQNCIELRPSGRWYAHVGPILHWDML